MTPHIASDAEAGLDAGILGSSSGSKAEHPGREKQKRAEDQVCNITQFCVTLKPAVIDAVSFCTAGELNVGRRQPPFAAVWHPRHFKTAKPALRTISRKVTSMTRELVAHNRPANETYDQLHSSIPKIAAGLVIWFVLMAWIFFDRQSVVALPLAFITVLFLVVALCFSGSFLVWYRHQPDFARHPNEIPFRDWITGNFSVWGSQQSAGQAATEILLPIAAAAVGMTVMGTIYMISASMVGSGMVS